MKNTVYLMSVLHELERLATNLYIAKSTRDKRSKEKSIREAKYAISDYAQTIDSEVIGTLYANVADGALSYQWCDDDIFECINYLEKWSKELQDESPTHTGK